MTRPSTLTPLTAPEPGDRFEVGAAADGRLLLPELLGEAPLVPEGSGRRVRPSAGRAGNRPSGACTSRSLPVWVWVPTQ